MWPVHSHLSCVSGGSFCAVETTLSPSNNTCTCAQANLCNRIDGRMSRYMLRSQHTTATHCVYRPGHLSKIQTVEISLARGVNKLNRFVESRFIGIDKRSKKMGNNIKYASKWKLSNHREWDGERVQLLLLLLLWCDEPFPDIWFNVVPVYDSIRNRPYLQTNLNRCLIACGSNNSFPLLYWMLHCTIFHPKWSSARDMCNYGKYGVKNFVMSESQKQQRPIEKKNDSLTCTRTNSTVKCSVNTVQSDQAPHDCVLCRVSSQNRMSERVVLRKWPIDSVSTCFQFHEIDNWSTPPSILHAFN